MIFGLKNIPVELVTLLNDDEKTPVSMIGQKMVPILEYKSKQFMPESMDIVQFIDKKYSPTIVSEEEDPALFDIFDSVRTAYYSLTMPRWVNSAMEEFKTPSARKYFQDKKEQMIGSFAKALENTENFKKEITKSLLKIEDKLLQSHPFHSVDSSNAPKNTTAPKNTDATNQSTKQSENTEVSWYLGKQISFNDFHLFALLRSLTIVRGLFLPPALESYIKHCSENTQIPLSKNRAL